jgi:hypothetical protein
MPRFALILIVMVIAFVMGNQATAQEAQASGVQGGAVMDIEGNWFSCEFAHSQIPPDDGCKMLDDDGFIVSKGKIDHVKVTNSTQRDCRHQREGQCFQREREQITVSSDSVGPIRAIPDGFAITYWGCTQEYTMRSHQKYFEVAPKGSNCLWTRDKRYFMARYQGRLEVLKR